MRLHPDVHMSSSEACRTADPRQIRRAALFLSVHVSPVSFSALFLLLHICTVSSIALLLLLHACPVSFSALFLLVHICTVSSIALFLSVHVFPVSLFSLLHICNDFFISILHCFLHSHFLHCVKQCIFALFSSTIAFVHFWTVAICAVFEGFYSCSFVMFLFSNFAFALSLNYHLFLLYNFSQLFPLNQVFYDCTFSHQSDRPLYFLPPSHSCWCQEPKLHCFYPPENSVFCTSLTSYLALCFVISASILVFAFIKRLLCSGKQY